VFFAPEWAEPEMPRILKALFPATAFGMTAFTSYFRTLRRAGTVLVESRGDEQLQNHLQRFPVGAEKAPQTIENIGRGGAI
jgi:hypothetical protein